MLVWISVSVKYVSITDYCLIKWFMSPARCGAWALVMREASHNHSWIEEGSFWKQAPGGAAWCHQLPPSENGFRAITRECLDRFTSNLVCGPLMPRPIHFKFDVWITHWQRKVPFENGHQVVPSENGSHAITRECFDQLTSNLICGSLVDRGRFLLKIGHRWTFWSTRSCCLSFRKGHS